MERADASQLAGAVESNLAGMKPAGVWPIGFAASILEAGTSVEHAPMTARRHPRRGKHEPRDRPYRMSQRMNTISLQCNAMHISKKRVSGGADPCTRPLSSPPRSGNTNSDNGMEEVPGRERAEVLPPAVCRQVTKS